MPPASAKLNPLIANLLIVVSAPSGGGKTTLCQALLESSANTVRAITCTTRPPREGEKDGVDYYFLDADEVRQLVEKKSRDQKDIEMISNNLAKIREKFTWPKIIDQYAEFIKECFQDKNTY